MSFDKFEVILLPGGSKQSKLHGLPGIIDAKLDAGKFSGFQAEDFAFPEQEWRNEPSSLIEYEVHLAQSPARKT